MGGERERARVGRMQVGVGWMVAEGRGGKCEAVLRAGGAECGKTVLINCVLSVSQRRGTSSSPFEAGTGTSVGPFVACCLARPH